VLIPLFVISFVVTVLVFAVSGIVTQWMIRKGGKKHD